MAISDQKTGDLRSLQRSMADLSDSKTRQVVAMLDALPHRGDADRLLDPLRSRLAVLRPPRPLRLSRLMFIPLDPLIVPSSKWQPGSPTVPRHAIEPLARVVQQTAVAEVALIQAIIQGRTVQDRIVAEQAGAILWPLAARTLADAPEPAAWAQAGLRSVLYRPMADTLSKVFSGLSDIAALNEGSALEWAAAPADRIEALLRRWAAQPPQPQAMLISLLLHAEPAAGSVLRRMAAAKAGVGRSLRHAAEQGAAVLLDRLETASGLEAPIHNANLADAAADVRHLAAVLEELGARAITAKERERVQRIRGRLDSSCQVRFTVGMETDILRALRDPDEPRSPEWQDALETAARRLRQLETEARKLGGGPAYDALLDEAAETMQTVSTAGLLTLPRQVRLTEILLGSDAALTLLDRMEPP